MSRQPVDNLSPNLSPRPVPATCPHESGTAGDSRPLHAQNLSPTCPQPVPVGVGGHLSPVPAAYKRGQVGTALRTGTNNSTLQAPTWAAFIRTPTSTKGATTMTDHAETLRADRAEQALRRREAQLARLLQMADTWDATWGDGTIRTAAVTESIRIAIRGEAA